MSLFKKRPQFQTVEYVSPPSTEILHAYPDEILPDPERTAKRRRIEEHARDYLKGRDLFISSASLRGPFNSGWANPWAKPAAGDQAAATREGDAVAQQLYTWRELDGEGRRTSGHGQLLNVVEPGVPESEARPVSRAGSDYCHDWLRKQNVQRYTPDLDDEFDTEIRDGDDITPSKPGLQKRAGTVPRDQRMSRSNVVPAWTAEPPEGISIQTEFLDKQAQLNSLQVDLGSSVAKRSISEQPLHDLYRRMIGMRDNILDETAFTKVSLIQDDQPQKKRGPYPRGQMLQGKDAESPGFPFRRVADSKRPISRDTDASKPSSTEADNVQQDTLVWVSVAPDGLVGSKPMDGVNQSEEDEIITIYTNDEGKWPCPMPVCLKRPKPYVGKSGVRGHLKNKHNIQHTRMDPDVEMGAVKPKRASLPKKAGANGQAGVQTTLVSIANTRQVATDGVVEASGIVVAHTVATEGENALPATALQNVALPEQDLSQPSTATVTETALTTAGESRLDEQLGPPQGVLGIGKALPPAVDDQSHHVVCNENGLESRNDESSTYNADAPLSKSATEQPNRQDSRAYSAFTFNPEMSTQAALLQAHQAFHDTQSPEKPTFSGADQQPEEAQPQQAVSKTITTADATTPFRKPGIPSFFTRGPESMSRAQLASTQDLMNAAADLTFSTAKKPLVAKKRISFADWPQAKPSQAAASESLKPVGWSPFVEMETPIAAGARSGQPLGPYRKSHSQQPEETPIKPVPHKQSSLSFPSAAKESGEVRQQLLPKSSIAGRSATSAPSELPIPSYQEAQDYDSLEIENVLDDAVSFLSTWDVDKEILRNSVGHGEH